MGVRKEYGEPEKGVYYPSYDPKQRQWFVCKNFTSWSERWSGPWANHGEAMDQAALLNKQKIDFRFD